VVETDSAFADYCGHLPVSKAVHMQHGEFGLAGTIPLRVKSAQVMCRRDLRLLLCEASKTAKQRPPSGGIWEN
jgi:hypothetical protein